MRYSVCLHHYIPLDVLDEYYCPECHYSLFLNMKHFIPYPIPVSQKQLSLMFTLCIAFDTLA